MEKSFVRNIKKLFSTQRLEHLHFGTSTKQTQG